jgi:pimeloyl-ACP methyl ester carboxylesterase
MRNLFLLATLLFACAAASAAEPCIKATTDCTRWVNLGGESRSLVYSTYPLDKKNEQIVRALIVVHGQGRDADNYFRTSLAAAFLANAFNDTIVIAPRLASKNGTGCKDTLAPNEVNWPCGGDSWRSGGTATNNAKLTSYDFMDEIVRELANKNNFPNLKAIVISGHSAGGQFATRYEMANKIHESVSVPITYVVANPSSYSYLDAERPSGTNAELRPFGDARNCTTYDTWPYGLKNRTGYTANIPDEQLKKQLASRPVTYLLGELDVLPLAGFDSSCPAMAQGPTRLARGQAFGAYVNAKYNAKHQVVVVPLCGHNARCMFTAEVALPILFPKV